MCDRFEYASVIQTIARHHIYKDIHWKNSRAEKNPTEIVLLWLLSKTESKRYVLNDSYYIIGHVPRTISAPCNLFLKKGGTISCVVIGPHQYSRDLEKLLCDQQHICQFVSFPHKVLVWAPHKYSVPSLMVSMTCWTSGLLVATIPPAWRYYSK